jgi:hypothetical protein|nr:MAG TPA: hypothetical protein [Caudoviricetes sp.]
MDHIIRQRLHELYDWLQICKEMCELYGYDVNEIAKDEIIKKKRKIRDIYKQENEKPERHIVHDNGIDGYIELLQLPEEITTRETADEWFQYNKYMEYVPSAFDCTGQRFTSWYKLVERNGRWWAYHCISVDV